jgi:hypothetical protein
MCTITNTSLTTSIAPQEGKSRHQRAAKISEAVSALARDTPPNNQPDYEADSQSPGVDPQSRGEGVAPGRMGENAPPSREGPFAQGVGRLERDDGRRGRDGDSTKQARGVRSPKGQVEEPARGGASVMETAEAGTPTSDTDAVAGTAEAISSTVPAAASTTTSTAPSPSLLDPTVLLRAGYGTATLLGSNTAGLIGDRAQLVQPWRQHKLAMRLAKRPKLLRSREAVKKEAEDFRSENGEEAKMPDELLQRLRKTRNAMPKTQAPLGPLQARCRKAFVNRTILGKYDPKKLLAGKKVYPDWTLVRVARGLLMNGTYVGDDGDRFRRKVQSLLPAAGTSRPPARQGVPR